MIKKTADHHDHQHDEPSTEGPAQPAPSFSAPLAEIDVESLAVIAAGLAKFLISIPNGMLMQIALGVTSELTARIAGSSSVGLEVSFDKAPKVEILDAMAVMEKVLLAFVAESAARALLKSIGAALETKLFERWKRNEDLPAQVAIAERLN